MGHIVLDELSPDELYSLRIEIEARIRRFSEASGSGRSNQPCPLPEDQPLTEPHHFQSIIQDGGIEGRFHLTQENLETIFQTQGQPSSSVLPGLNHGILMNQEIESLGPGRDTFPAQTCVATTPALLLQPQQTRASDLAANDTFFEFDSLALKNQPSCTMSSAAWAEASQSHLMGEAPDAASNVFYPAENVFTWQHGTASPSMSSGSFPSRSMPQLGIPQHFKPYASHDRSLNERLPVLDDSEPAPNGMESMTSNALVGRNTQIYAYDLSGNEWPMNFGSAVPGPETSERQRIQSLQCRRTAQVERKGRDEMGNAGTTKSVARKRKRGRGFPDNFQRAHANEVRGNRGACARCTKQRIKCIINPADPEGDCLSCLKLNATLDRQPQCFWGKITDVVLIRDNVDPDYGKPTMSERFDIGIGILKPITKLEAERKEVELTRGLGRTIRVCVLKAKALDQADVPESQQFIYERPWILADFLGTVEEIRHFLWGSLSNEITNKIKMTERPLAFVIFGKAYQLAKREQEPSILLQRALMVWSGSRHVEGGWHFHGSETLGLQTNKEGKVPLTATAILDCQISSIIVVHHLKTAQALVIAEIQKLFQNNAIRRKHMFELFLAYFILLDNCECIMKHQRNWAIHNNSPFRYTPQMMKLVEGILHTVKIILRHWRSDIKGQFPFSPEWDPDRGPKIAEFTHEQLFFLKGVGKRIKGKEAYFNQLFRSWENYDRDYCFTGQLFVRDGQPFVQDWLEMPDMPDRPPAPKYGPARLGHQSPIPPNIVI